MLTEMCALSYSKHIAYLYSYMHINIYIRVRAHTLDCSAVLPKCAADDNDDDKGSNGNDKLRAVHKKKKGEKKK